ncbi:MAG TPA: hypothetical protein VGY97_03325 [Solirubrobacteraceae bacterium]|jgi:hypothetical protein|nr:hypothetical protein [Solirubrobacteraceae bacterium]
MPMEGQWARSHSPLRQLGKRERRLLATLAVVAVAGIVAVVLVATLAGGSSRLAPGCIQATVAGATGGEQLTACGTDAATLCRAQVDGHGPQADVLREPCRRAGYR